MNNWVAMNTRDKIKTLILPGVLSANTIKDTCDAHAIQLPFRDSELLKADFIEQNITVQLPKFKLSEGDPPDAKELLIQCGIHDVFDFAKANLSKIRADERCFVSDVLHKSVLEIDKEGATAAAATAFMAFEASRFGGPPPFMVDHPFFIGLVCDTSVPVFVGHVTKPGNP
ncbi:Leukocyte elastase inhibitor [Clonorchis sinensis]|uniref:Leukocyte elastase inhibitor n=1 Tax=Clonorchis sinensis TaxID=79923 RepID=A0A419QI35_CLOSI|nr:Leukocyte elastase inhibitor [Clonorchis sinensis]